MLSRVLLALKIARHCCKAIVFQIFIDATRVKRPNGAQMNTNSDMLPVSVGLVHTRTSTILRKNAQKFGKMLPH